jgi:hypothetical protein
LVLRKRQLFCVDFIALYRKLTANHGSDPAYMRDTHATTSRAIPRLTYC